MERRILALIAFFDVFDRAVEKEFVYKYVFGDDSGVKEALDGLLRKKEYIGSDGWLVYLSGRESLVNTNTQKQILSRRNLEKASSWGKYFRFIPFIKFCAVCNYLPFGVADDGSDIDLLVITKEDRIFTARTFLTIFAHLAGVRRHGKKIKGRFCLSFYVSEKCLNFQPVLLDPDDIYMAFWVLGIFPVYGDKVYLKKIFNENKIWLQNYFSFPLKGMIVNVDLPDKKNFFAKIFEFVLCKRFGDIIEDLLGRYFLYRYKKNSRKFPNNASIEISKLRLKYHNQDRRDYFRKEWLSRLERLGFPG